MKLTDLKAQTNIDVGDEFIVKEIRIEDEVTIAEKISSPRYARHSFLYLVSRNGQMSNIYSRMVRNGSTASSGPTMSPPEKGARPLCPPAQPPVSSAQATAPVVPVAEISQSARLPTTAPVPPVENGTRPLSPRAVIEHGATSTLATPLVSVSQTSTKPSVLSPAENKQETSLGTHAQLTSPQSASHVPETLLTETGPSDAEEAADNGVSAPLKFPSKTEVIIEVATATNEVFVSCPTDIQYMHLLSEIDRACVTYSGGYLLLGSL